VVKHLSKQYETIEEAEEALQVDYVADMRLPTPSQGITHSTPAKIDHKIGVQVQELLSPVFSHSPSKHLTATTTGDMVKEFITQNSMMTKRMKWQVLHHLYKSVLIEEAGPELASFVKPDFLDISLRAMRELLTMKKHNLIYDLCACFEKRDNENETRMPMDRMPFGLVDYNIRFFAANYSQKLGMEEHYAQWLETMFAHFGHKWLCLHRGPTWKYDVEEESVQLPECQQSNSNPGVTANPPEVEKQHTNTIIADALADLHIDLDDYQLPLQIDCDVQEEQSLLDPTLENVKRSSTLWTSLGREETIELEEGSASAEAMEQHHRIQPTGTKRTPVNPNMYDTMKVQFVYCNK
jgi:hypothetical protein